MADRVKKLSKKDIKAKIDEGWLHVNVLFELVGNPQAHIEQTLQSFLDNIDQDKHIITTMEEVEETLPLEGSDGLFSAAAEVEYLVFGLEKLTWFAFNFLPASLEIKAPSELVFREKDFSNWMNDLLAKLHEVNTTHTSLASEYQQVVKNLNIAIRNSVLLALKSSAEDARSVAKSVGIGEETVQQFLDAMVKEGKLVVDGKKYSKA